MFIWADLHGFLCRNVYVTEIIIEGFYNVSHILYVVVGLSLKTYIVMLVLVVCVDAVGRWHLIVLKAPIWRLAPIPKYGGKNTILNSPDSSRDWMMAIMIGIRCGCLLNEAAPVYAYDHEQNRSVVIILIYVSCNYWNGWINRWNWSPGSRRTKQDRR